MKISNWLIGLLLASLVINFLAIGFIIGRMGDSRMAMTGPDPMLGFPQVLQVLPDERRQELAPMIRAHMKALRPSIRSMRTTQAALRAALTAEPFDRGELERALASFRSHLDESQKASHQSLANFVAALTPQERVLLSGSMNHPGRHPYVERMHRPPPAQE